MKNKKVKYILYLIFLHSICIFFSLSRFLFSGWGEWLTNTQFLQFNFSVYMAMIIGIFPLLSIIPYHFQHDFPNVSIEKKLILAALLIGNTLLILTYNAFISKIGIN